MSGSPQFIEPLESRQLYSATPVVSAAPDVSHAAITVAAAKLPSVFAIDPSSLAAAKTDLADGDSSLEPAYKSLISNANSDLNMTPVSVTDKAPPKGISSHDYVSYAKYWWPNPNTKSGLPYVQKDGYTNSAQVAKGDYSELSSMLSAVDTLAVAYYLSGTASYATQATKLLEVWFLNSKTKMSPNMSHAQIALGVNNGAGTGILDLREISDVTDAIGILRTSSAWSKSDDKGMTAWFTSYNSWLGSSGNAKAEKAATNNHGTWYDVQQMDILLFLGKTSAAKSLAKSFETNRINKEIKSDGSQPLELARQDGWSYSIFNLDAMFAMATLADRVGVDLWDYTGKSGGSIKKALNYVAPYADSSKTWPNNQLNSMNRNSLIPLLLQAENVYGGSTYTKDLGDLPSGSVSSNVENLYLA